LVLFVGDSIDEIPLFAKVAVAPVDVSDEYVIGKETEILDSI
jgi:hypothetical protein